MSAPAWRILTAPANAKAVETTPGVRSKPRCCRFAGAAEKGSKLTIDNSLGRLRDDETLDVALPFECRDEKKALGDKLKKLRGRRFKLGKRDVGPRARYRLMGRQRDTTHTAAWDAKNRQGFEEHLPFEFAAVASAFGASTVSQPAAPVANPIEKLAELVAGKEDEVNAFLIARQQIKTGQTWRDVAPDYALRVLGKPNDFLTAVSALATNGGAK